MKRFLSVVLTLCCVCSVGFAQEQKQPLRVRDSWVNAEYAARYPDRELEPIELSYNEQERSNLQQILESGQWDLAVVSTTDVSLSALDDAGLLMDLGTVPELAVRFKNMFPALLEAVSKDEKLLALPCKLPLSQTMKMRMTDVVKYPDQEIHVRETLGFTEQDVPRTFAQLCDLAQSYMALSKEIRKGTVFDIDSAMGNAKNYFLYYLIQLYTAQYIDLDGHIDYDTALFRESLEHVEKMSKALAKDTKISYQQGGSGVRICGLFSDDGSHFIGKGKLLTIEEQDARIAAHVEVIVINPKTEHLSEALDYCSLLLEAYATEWIPLVYQSYDRKALVQRFREENLSSAMESKDQVSIDLAMADMERTDDADFYYTEEEIAEYRENIAPYLVFPRIPFVDTYAIAKEYVRGRLDVDGLIQKLNKTANEALE